MDLSDRTVCMKKLPDGDICRGTCFRIEESKTDQWACTEGHIWYGKYNALKSTPWRPRKPKWIGVGQMRRRLWWFLRKPIQVSADKEKVDRSWSQWGGYNELDPVCRAYFDLYGPDQDRYTLSIIGWINGWLPRLTGCVLCITAPEDGRYIQDRWKLQVRKKWW